MQLISTQRSKISPNDAKRKALYSVSILFVQLILQPPFIHPDAFFAVRRPPSRPWPRGLLSIGEEGYF